MSHISEIAIQVKDLDSLEAACRELGLELVRGQTKYKWFGQWVGDTPLPPGVKKSDLGKCDHAIRIPGNEAAYQIGVCKNSDGTFSLRWDFWCGGYGLEERVGSGAGKLIQSYAAEVAMRQARKQGYAVQRR